MERCGRILTLLAVLGVAAIPWRAQPALACSCAAAPNYLGRADVVFAGTAVEVGEGWNGGLSTAPRYVSFAVERVWLGAPTPEIRVATESSGASCGYEFQENVRYLVYGTQSGDGPVRTGLCTGTRPYSDADARILSQAAGPGTPVESIVPISVVPADLSPETNSGLQDDWPKLALLAATSLAAAAATLAIARRR